MKASAHCICDKTSKACKKNSKKISFIHFNMPGPVVQVILISDPGVVSSIPTQPHTFVEIYHEIFSMLNLLLSLCSHPVAFLTNDFDF